MNENKTEGIYGPLVDIVKDHETNIVSTFCAKILATNRFPTDEFTIRRGGTVVTGNIVFGQNDKYYIVSINDKPDGKTEIHHDYAMDKNNSAILYTNYKASPGKTVRCIKYIGKTVKSNETITFEGDNQPLTFEEQQSVKELLYVVTPFLIDSISLPIAYTYEGNISLGYIAESISKDAYEFRYGLSLTPKSAPSSDGLRLWIEDGKVRIRCYISDGEPQSVEYDSFIEKYPFDDSTIKGKIAILEDMGFDISTVPDQLKPHGKGQK